MEFHERVCRTEFLELPVPPVPGYGAVTIISNPEVFQFILQVNVPADTGFDGRAGEK
jgi:hypothetical protein